MKKNRDEVILMHRKSAFPTHEKKNVKQVDSDWNMHAL